MNKKLKIPSWITVDYIEKFLSCGKPYYHQSNKNLLIESMNLPSFCETFNGFLDSDRLPSEDEFIDKYLENHLAKIVEKTDNKDEIDGLIGRLSRTYPSLLRELHFYCLVREHPWFKDKIMKRSNELDMMGSDFVILHDGNEYHIRVYLETYRGLNYLNQKNKANTDDITHIIDVGLRKENSFTLNNYWMFDDTNVQKIIDKINEKQTTGRDNKGAGANN